MKKVIALGLCLFILNRVSAQIKNPVEWSFSSKKIDASTFEIVLSATLDQGWHVYSQTTPDGGPVATSVLFTKNPLLVLDGSVKEVGKLEQHHEELFGVDVKQFSNRVDFVQTLTLKSKVKTTVSGTIEFMTCNNKECLPPTSQNFSVALE